MNREELVLKCKELRAKHDRNDNPNVFSQWSFMACADLLLPELEKLNLEVSTYGGLKERNERLSEYNHKLATEAQGLQQDLNLTTSAFQSNEIELKKCKEQNAKLEAALQFYADEMSEDIITGEKFPSHSGKLARSVLAEIKEGK